MSWTTPHELKAQLTRLWEHGALARALVSDEATFPLRLTLKGPGASDLTDRFDAVRAWAAAVGLLHTGREQLMEVARNGTSPRRTRRTQIQ